MDSPRPHPAVRALWLALGAALAALVAYAGWRRMAPSPPPPTPHVRGIVLFCFDTLRQDSFSLPGAPPGPMPTLQGIASRGSVYVNASASACWTAPSITTLLTGIRPVNHGVTAFGNANPLISAVVTLAEMLRAGGWYTAAATAGGWVSPDQGLDQGFDRFSTTYDDPGVAGSSLRGTATAPRIDPSSCSSTPTPRTTRTATRLTGGVVSSRPIPPRS